MTNPRVRTTWSQNDKSREAALSRRADVYTMNQDHPQPSPVEYENGDPDSWAETPAGNQYIYDGYDGGEGGSEARNEVGFVEFKPETFKHKDSDSWNGSGKYDNAKVSAVTSAMKKANLATKLARATLRTSSEVLIKKQASDYMNLPDSVLTESLQRVNQASFIHLPEAARYKRSLACCKLATKVLSSYEPNESAIEKLARAFMEVDDPTLKNIFSTLASIEANEAVVAASDEDEDAEETTSSMLSQAGGDDEDEDDTEVASSDEDEDDTEVAASADDEDEADVTAGADESCGVEPAEMAMLDEMISEDGGGQPSGNLADLFSLFGDAPAPAAPQMGPVVPVHSVGSEISFSDDSETRTASFGDPNELMNIFNDDEEVRAQRDIVAAHHEQAARESGYAGVSKTASSGAKRLGNVRSGAPSSDGDLLESIWERP